MEETPAINPSVGEYPVINPARFAREVVTAVLEGIPLPEPLGEEYYRRRAACFVSIKREGELRGCIGTLEPAEPDLGLEIVRNAQSAAFSDPRFPAVTAAELPGLSFSVDVLGEPEPVASREELDPGKYGVIVACDFRRGVLLPDLEGVDTVAHQLSIACQKAGIAGGEEFAIQRFTVTRFHEE